MVRFLVCLVVLLALLLGASMVLDRLRTVTITVTSGSNGPALSSPIAGPVWPGPSSHHR